MTDKLKPQCPWIVALLIGLPVVYIASFGPACWWLSRDVTSGGYRRAPAVYLPFGWAARRGPEPIQKVIAWYATRGGPVVLPFELFSPYPDGGLYLSPPFDDSSIPPELKFLLETSHSRSISLREAPEDEPE